MMSDEQGARPGPIGVAGELIGLLASPPHQLPAK